MPSNGKDQPLSGIKVVDLTQIYQGPYASFLMAQAGADVVKVEPPGGERLRGAGGARTPVSFVMLNSNKRSVTLNLKHERGRAMLLDLARHADVLLENYAPGVMDRLGVGWEILRDINPGLIYGSGTGYGLSGPDRDMLAMDHTIQAASGIMSVTGDEGQPPARAGGAPCDIMGGVHMYAGVMAALVGRHRTGKGTLVQVSMLESMYFTLCSELTNYHIHGRIPPRNSARTPSSACPYGRYACTDGYIALISVSDTHWENILGVIGRRELLDHTPYKTPADRRLVEDEINELIESYTASRSRDDAYQAFRKARVPVAPVRGLDEVMRNEHLHQRGMLHDMVHEVMGELVMPSSPIRYSGYDASDLQFFPDVGQHNPEVYGDWLGLSGADLAALQHQGAI
jgi:CoA:oxalate CoA-transferase